jgi:hypothetical protein
MSSIKIKNFGPIKEGYAENDGFIPIQKYMAFIGSQGSGKSSVVKLITTFSWLEKALFQGREFLPNINLKFKDTFCANLSIQNYFLKNTYIEYRGVAYIFVYENEYLEIRENNLGDYLVPKISFIPAERNLISVLENARKVEQLPYSLSWCLEEFDNACVKYSETLISLPINNIDFIYDDIAKSPIVKGVSYSLKLAQAASGIQSITPMFIVMYYLNDFMENQDTEREKNSSLATRKEVTEEIDKIWARNLPVEIENFLMKKAYSKFRINNLINILEEIEQNLFPDSQRAILNKALEFTNNLPDNKLILTTHSPYIIGYLTLAMKGFMLKQRIENEEKLTTRLNEIVPVVSCINPEDVGVYELDLEGKISRVEIRNGIISGKNYLNEKMKEENTLFDKLLEIEEELEWVK